MCSRNLARALVFVLALTPVLQAQQPAAGGNWERVKSLPTRTKLHITTDHGGKTCRVFAITDDALTCAKFGGTTGTVLQRSEIKHIKLTHALRSTLVGAGIGGGLGATIGGIAGHTAPCTGFCFNIIDGKTLALITGVTFGVVGGVVGVATDFARGSSIYTRP